MSETKYGKYILTELIEPEPEEKHPWAPKFTPEELVHIVCLDSNIIEGAFYVATDWTYPPFAKESHGKPHKHDFDEVLAFSEVTLRTLMNCMRKPKYPWAMKYISSPRAV